MISTTVFTTSGSLSIPRTLSLDMREGSGKIFLDTTRSTFHPGWQHQLHRVYGVVRKFFGMDFDTDFFISIESQIVDGWSTSLPLFLLFVSALTGEPLPSHMFSTGCMFSPDGWITHGKREAVQSKIDTSEAFAEYSSIENPVFMIPFSPHQYKSEKVHLFTVSNAFSALEIALPLTFQKSKYRMHTLVRVESQADLREVLPSIPAAGDVFIAIHAGKLHQPTYSKSTSGKIPLIVEELGEVPEGREVFLYFIRDSTVVFKHVYYSMEDVLAAVPCYQEVIQSRFSRIQ